MGWEGKGEMITGKVTQSPRTIEVLKSHSPNNRELGNLVELWHLPAVVGVALVPEVHVGGGEDLEVLRVVPAQLLGGKQPVRDNTVSAGARMLCHTLDEDDLRTERTLAALSKR